MVGSAISDILQWECTWTGLIALIDNSCIYHLVAVPFNSCIYIELPSSSYVNVLLSCMQNSFSILQKNYFVICLGEPAINLSELLPPWPLCSLTTNTNI